MPFNLGFQEILVVLVVAVLVFGGNLPKVARQVARTISDFKRGMRDELRRLEETEPVPKDLDLSGWDDPDPEEKEEGAPKGGGETPG